LRTKLIEATMPKNMKTRVHMRSVNSEKR